MYHPKKSSNVGQSARTLWVLEVPKGVCDALLLLRVPRLSTLHLWESICFFGGLGTYWCGAQVMVAKPLDNHNIKFSESNQSSGRIIIFASK